MPKLIVFGKIVIPFIAMLLFSFLSHAQNNYCHDKESWQEGEELVRQHPHNMDIQFLHAVRIGFCEKIEAGTIDFDTAKEVFNRLHEKVIKKANKENKKKLENSQL